MREIKFRALFRGVWVFFTLNDLIQIDRESMTDEDYAILNHDPNTRGQYTGLHDKNGKEIYEWDVLRIGDHWAIGWSNSNKIVEFDDGAFFPFGEGDWNPGAEGVEIIGNIFENIFENPDLLK